MPLPALGHKAVSAFNSSLTDTESGITLIRQIDNSEIFSANVIKVSYQVEVVIFKMEVTFFFITFFIRQYASII